MCSCCLLWPRRINQPSPLKNNLINQHQSCLVRTYGQPLGTNMASKTTWPELVGLTADEAEKKIKEERPVVQVQVVPPNNFVTMDFRQNRVRLYVDSSGKVDRAPRIG
ncbi:hypothetical protein Pint_35372 [Pistacia integerrima]|uniref:Uncharacterized protein n=1 Tax=Pistacia integerrima TaxID=434235 RepID=A0ACC0Y1V7_9ROSI|nr:hypothetical protein Pint_35372 [Pistacia integerrima]